MLVGDPDLQVELVRKSLWYVNQQHATNYQVGRVFCGGDAVHRHPPSSGLGSNTSIQDAFNIAWKVAFVVKGHAGPGLLDSYTPERAPVGKQIVARANQSRKDYAGLREWFDRDSDDPVRDGLIKLKEASPEGVARRERLYEALELKNTEFNAHGVELNQRYDSGAVLPDPDSEPEEWPRHREVYLQATTRPGAKLPHAWLVGADGRRVSTLDVTGKGQMTLLTGLGGQAWKHAAGQLDLPFLRTVVVGEPGTHRPVRLLAPGAGDPRGRGAPGAPRRLRRLAAEQSGLGRRRGPAPAAGGADRGVGPTGRQAVRRPPRRTRVQHPGGPHHRSDRHT